MFACEKSVALAPKNVALRGSRGVGRALTGDRKGAIEDFEVYVQWTNSAEARANNNEQWLAYWRSKMQRWIADLKANKNPFTPEEMKSLLNQ